MSETTDKLQLARWAWDNKGWVADRLKDLRAWWYGSSPDDNKPGILMLGAGGSGKTTLAQMLARDVGPWINLLGRYEESIAVETFTLADDPDVEIVVPPGQLHRRPGTWDELHARVAGGEYRGIIMLCAYGYHSLGPISYKQHRLYQGNKKSFLAAYLEDRRAEELGILRQLVPFVGQCQSKLWMLTVVTKRNLWWAERAEVERHYQEGDYSAALREMAGRLGARQFCHQFAFASLLISNFNTGVGEPLSKNVAGYDQSFQFDSLKRLFETADSLREWESQQ